jgi:hypothetical protein
MSAEAVEFLTVVVGGVLVTAVVYEAAGIVMRHRERRDARHAADANARDRSRRSR